MTNAPQMKIDGNAFSKPAWGWTLFEFARNPYFMIIVMYLFAPYAAKYIGEQLLSETERLTLSPEARTALIGTKGQAAIAYLTMWAGLVSAFTSPFLGAALDNGGRRKPLMAFVLAVIGICSVALWWVKPDGSGWSVTATMTILAIAYAFYNYSEVLHNSQLSIAARPKSVPYVSGIGLALGNLAVVFLYVILLICFIVPAEMGMPYAQPLLGLDVESQEAYRIAGPVVTIWMAIFSIPYFMWTNDGGTKGAKWIPAIKDGMAALFNTFANAKKHKEALKYLFARMLYADGMSAALSLGAVFIGTFLGWSALEMATYALVMSVFAFIGGLTGGFLDRYLGPRNALILEISVLLCVFLFQLSITRESLAYGQIENYQIWDGPIFASLSDIVYLCSAMVLAVAGTAMISSSRSMLVHVAPKEKMGEFFGLYMIVGTITAWVGPLMVAVFTTWFQDQRVGMGSLTILFVAGLIVLFFVNAPKERA